VTLTNVGTNAVQTTTSESNGFFRFSLWKPGLYALAIKQAGCKSVAQKIEVSVFDHSSFRNRLKASYDLF